jgi:hypothetical protein
VNSKSAFILGVCIIFASSVHSWLSRPDPYPPSTSSRGNVQFYVRTVNDDRVQVIAIDPRNGETWSRLISPGENLGAVVRWLPETKPLPR